MPSIISSTSSRRDHDRDMPPTYTTIYSTSPSSSHGPVRSKASTPGLSSIGRLTPSPRSTTSRSSRGDSKNDPPQASSRFGSYVPTTVSSYNRRIETVAEGLPGPMYFSSGQSKVDRRREYVQPPSPAPSSPRNGRSNTSGVSRGSKIGKELIKYRDPYANDSDDSDADDQTIRPSDSISQISHPSSYTSSRGRRSRRDSGYSGSGAGDSSSTFSKISTFASDKVYDGHRNYWLEERRPRASALGRVEEVR